MSSWAALGGYMLCRDGVPKNLIKEVRKMVWEVVKKGKPGRPRKKKKEEEKKKMEFIRVRKSKGGRPKKEK